MNRSTRILALVVAAQAAFLCSTFQHWHTVGVGALIVVGWALLNQRHHGHRINESPSPLVDRLSKPLAVGTAMLIIAVACFAWRSFGVLDDTKNFIAIAADVLAHFCFLSSLMLWVLRPSRGHLLMPFLGLATVLLCVASGGVSRSLPSQTTVGVLVCIGFVVATKTIFANRLGTRPGNSTDQSRQQRRVAVIATGVVLMTVTGAIASITDSILPDIQDDLQRRLKSTMEVVQNNRMIGGMRYVRGSSLGSVRRHLTTDPQAVVLNVYSDQTPGYLRGTVFDLYRSSKWASTVDQMPSDRSLGDVLSQREIVALGPGRAELNSRSNKKLSRFQLLPEDSGRPVQMEIVSDPKRGNNVFLPLGTRWIEASGSSVTLSGHHSVLMGVDNREPYVAGVEALSAECQLTENERMVLTYLSAINGRTFGPIAQQICADAETAAEKAAAISDYFQTNFQYGVEAVNRPGRADPLSYFMTTRHPAHCEFFATATTLMLRATGVPSRYVVGYVSDEESDDAGRWLARNRDAHAWAEAYDDRTKRWFAVESTPGRSYQSVIPVEEFALQSQSSMVGEQSSADDGDGLISNLWSYLASIRATDTFFTLFRYSQMLLLFGLAGWLIRRWRKRHASPEEVAERASRKMLARVESVVARSGFVRASGETLHQFSDRLEHAINPTSATSDNVGKILSGEDVSDDHRPKLSEGKRSQIQRAAIWLRRFAEARYQGMTPASWSG
jgi:hypothetical protein